MVFSKSYCPYCQKSKDTLTKGGVEFKALDLDLVSDGNDIQSELLKMTGQRTVPNTFIGGQHVGGNDDLNSKISKG